MRPSALAGPPSRGCGRCAWRRRAPRRRGRSGPRRPRRAKRSAKPAETVMAPRSSLVERRFRAARGHFHADLLERLGDIVRASRRERSWRTPRRRSGRRTGAARQPADDAGDIAQHLVAGLMAPGVVEGLEVVDVEHGQGQGLALGAACSQARSSSSSKALRLARLVRPSVMASRRTCSRFSRSRLTSAVVSASCCSSDRVLAAAPCGWRRSGSRPGLPIGRASVWPASSRPAPARFWP